MAEHGFTPGKWAIAPRSYGWDHFAAIVTDNFKIIGTAHIAALSRDHEETAANAKLMAASPTLLEAVLAAEDYFATLPADDAAHSLYLQMNAAITLATGKDA